MDEISIKALKLGDCFIELIQRTVDCSEIQDETIAMLDLDNSLSLYERIVVNEKIVKPTEKRLLSELQEYKDELLKSYRKEEDLRIKDLKNRWNAIGIYANDCYLKAGFAKVSNLEADFFRDVLLKANKEVAESMMSTLENQLPIILLEISNKKDEREQNINLILNTKEKIVDRFEALIAELRISP